MMKLSEIYVWHAWKFVTLWKQGCEASLCNPTWEGEGWCGGSSGRRFQHFVYHHTWPGSSSSFSRHLKKTISQCYLDIETWVSKMNVNSLPLSSTTRLGSSPRTQRPCSSQMPVWGRGERFSQLLLLVLCWVRAHSATLCGLCFWQHCIVLFWDEGEAVCPKCRREEVCDCVIKDREADRYWCWGSEKCCENAW